MLSLYELKVDKSQSMQKSGHSVVINKATTVNVPFSRHIVQFPNQIGHSSMHALKIKLSIS